MSNADYKRSGGGAFATFVKTDVAFSYLDSSITYDVHNFAVSDPIQPGQAAMWEDEIIRIETVVEGGFTCKRGCADTVPQQHAAGSLIWLITPTSQVGTDRKERSAGEEIGVKVTPYTIGGGSLPVGNSDPDAITFNWRFFRPYPPANVKTNNAVWYSGAAINDATGGMNLTWFHRDRVLQADQLLGHSDASIGPEPGTTYTLRIYAPDGTTLLRTEPGIRGESFLYQHSKALKDFGYPASAVDGLATFSSEREGFESWEWYVTPMHIEPSASPITPVWMNFWQWAFEAPYIYNARHGLSQEPRAIGVASRPGDRMSDGYNLIRHWVEFVEEPPGSSIMVPHDHNDAVATGSYTPWFTLEFGITELETTINVGSMSLWDGVRIPNWGDLVGKIALIEMEYIVFKALDGDVYTIGRGVGDSIPSRHIAGVGVVFFDHVAVVDPNVRTAGETHEYRFQPLTYGSLPDPNTLPVTNMNSVFFNNRAIRPYNVAQLVVAGRPWYEEAQVVSGQALPISWAWRNRVTQGATPYDHAYPSISPEAGTQAVLTFFYFTPPTTPGGEPVQHVLRTVVVDPIYPTPGADANQGFYSYPYSFAQADGAAAGAALGICGTVVITCAIYTIRDGHASGFQHYWIPIRVPSYPCT